MKHERLGLENCLRAGPVRENLPGPQFALSGIRAAAGNMKLDASIQWLMCCSRGRVAAPAVSFRERQHVVGWVVRDGLIASGGRTVYVLGAALRAAFSDA